MNDETTMGRLSRGMTPHPSRFMVLEAKHSFKGTRYDVSKGERRTIRYGYDDPNALPKVCEEARAGQAIDWGGCVCTSASYSVLFDDVGPLPADLT